MMDETNNSKEFRILGLPEVTRYGILKQLKVKDYPKISKYLSFFNSTPQKIKSDLLMVMNSNTKNKNIIKRFSKELKENELVYFIIQNKFNIKDDIMEMVNYIFLEKEKNIESIIFESDDSWDVFRKTILKINGFNVEDNEQDRPKSDLELLFETAEQVMNERKGLVTDFHAIYTSILVETGLSPDDINNLTINQFFSIYRRIGKFKQYDTQTLFKTVDSKGKIKIIPWSVIDEVNKENDNKILRLSQLATKEKIEDIDLKKGKTEVITNER